MVILESERMLFRPHQPRDLDPFCAMEQDPEVRRYVGGAPRTREAAEQRFWNVTMQEVDDRLAMWATVLKESGRYIGRRGLYPNLLHSNIQGYEEIPDEAVLAFYLSREFWGRGLATEAGSAFLAFGFEQLNLKRVVATVEEGNEASMQILKKLGFVITDYDQGERSFYRYELKNPSVPLACEGGRGC